MLQLLVSLSANSITELYFRGFFLHYHIIKGPNSSGNNVFTSPYIGISCPAVDLFN